jgi:hypothetical protein
MPVMSTRALLAMLAMGFAACAAMVPLAAQQAGVERLAAEVFDVLPPSDRVRGGPGQMKVQARPCRALPLQETRRRLVDVAVQEWAFFGFRVVDRTEIAERAAAGSAPAGRPGAPVQGGRGGRRRPSFSPEEGARLAASIAGYWAVTPEGSWIVERQNDEWTGPDGTAARWNAPWSAAFISWVMCEGGLGGPNQFQRAIAHHAYIDQAIRARDGRSPQAAFVAYDTGEAAISPGDLLCSSRQPIYRTIAERRRQAGVGARAHCDVVVMVDEGRERILAIGGNVRGIVALKLLRAQRTAGQPLRVVDPDEERPIFAHLKLRAESIGANPLSTSPTMKALGCGGAGRTPALLAAAAVAAADLIAARC